MKYIIKNTEPKSLKEHRCSTPNPSFNDCNKEKIRLALLKEQGSICAYCMQRISNNWNSSLSKFKTEIEHYKSQDVYNGKNGKPDLRLAYKNMLGVCNGNAGQPKNKQHCDKSKDFEKNKQYLPLTIDPLNPNCETFIEYKSDGRIFSENLTINKDLILVLNLNENSLKNNRKNAIIYAIKSIGKTSWRSSDINTEIRKWERLYSTGYKPYCQAVIFYLKKKLNTI